MDGWTRFTDCRGYEKTDRVIEWFWACLRSWPAERKARLLHITMGTSRVPVNGFKDIHGSDGLRRFTIEKSGGPSGLPRSHTCFNRLDRPPYEDHESLERKTPLRNRVRFSLRFPSELFSLTEVCVGRQKVLGKSTFIRLVWKDSCLTALLSFFLLKCIFVHTARTLYDILAFAGGPFGRCERERIQYASDFKNRGQSQRR